jgi:diapolycopene oxygenase
MKSAAIIGSGVAGLATAIRLVAQGFCVDVFEKESYPGGKLAELYLDGFRFDLGPSLFTQPERVEELFILMGETPSDHFRYQRLNHICRYFWPDGSTLDVPSDPSEFEYLIRKRFDEGSDKPDAASLSAYLNTARELYTLAAPLFLDQPFPTRGAFLSDGGRQIGKNPFILDPFVSLHHRNAKTFKDPRLVQLFDRYATYNGSNPYKAPATLKMIAHLEHNLGAFFPEKGMYSIARELTDLAIRHGVRFHFDSPVRQVNRNEEGNRVTGVTVQGKSFDFDVVVSDLDINTFYQSGLIDCRPPLLGRNQSLSTSAMIFYWGISGVHPSLDLHNILFAREYQEEFKYLFKTRQMYFDPTVYIFISSKQVPGDAPSGSENWFVMVNAPENVGQNWDQAVTQTKEKVLNKIRLMLDIDLTGKIRVEHIEDPRTIESRTGSWHGSLYGNSSNSRMSAFSRHPNHRGKLKGLYFTGGSVHPGGGIPLCLASAGIVAELISKSRSYE